MLTAHALSPENTVKAYHEGAASYVPKDKIAEITTYPEDIWEAKEKEKHFWWRRHDRFAAYYGRKFGVHWKKSDEKSWEKFGAPKE